jgi:YNFM family putative membrane transporter
MLAAGFSTFALLYCVQPLLPVFSAEFGVSAAESSLALSLTTGFLAGSVLIAGSLSETLGRKPIMLVSLVAAAVLTFVSAFTSNWHALLAIRALLGICFSGLPAVAMAYLSEEVERMSVGRAMGLYIAGSGFGGMAGRFITGLLTDLSSWRVATGVLGVMGMISAAIFWRMLPPSKHFVARRFASHHLRQAFVEHITDAGLPWLFLEAFLLMGSFVTTYNYIGYRLMAPPYSLSFTAVGSIFTAYLMGVASSAGMGELSSRFGRRKIFWINCAIALMGVGLTLSARLAIIIAGIAVLTFGFFGAHSVASSWVGLRARHSKALSLLLLFRLKRRRLLRRFLLASGGMARCGDLHRIAAFHCSNDFAEAIQNPAAAGESITAVLDYTLTRCICDSGYRVPATESKIPLSCFSSPAVKMMSTAAAFSSR